MRVRFGSSFGPYLDLRRPAPQDRAGTVQRVKSATWHDSERPKMLPHQRLPPLTRNSPSLELGGGRKEQTRLDLEFGCDRGCPCAMEAARRFRQNPLVPDDDSVYQSRTSAGFSGPTQHFRPLRTLQHTHSAWVVVIVVRIHAREPDHQFQRSRYLIDFIRGL